MNNAYFPKPRPVRRYDGPSLAGFSMVEILVCIAILGVLCAFVFQVVKATSERSKQARCVSHQRQLFQFWSLYSADHNGRVLPAYYSEKVGESTIKAEQWFDLLDRIYLADAPQAPSSKSITLRQCPGNPGRNTYWGTANYAYNNDLGVTDIQKGVDEKVYLANLVSPARLAILIDAGIRKVRVPTVVNPKYQTFYFFVQLIQGSGFGLRSSTLSEDGSSFQSGHISYQWHGGRANFLFADGHVESLDEREVQKRIDSQQMFLRPNSL